MSRSHHIHETDGTKPVSAYDELYAGYPPRLKRFLAAAHVSVRGDPGLRGIETADPAGFRNAVAQAAYRMARLSSQDSSPRQSPTASTLDPIPRVAEEVGAMPTSRMEGAAPLPPIRILAGDEGLFMLRIGPETKAGISELQLRSRLLAWDVAPEDADRWIALAKLHGELTSLPVIFDPEGFNALDARIGKGLSADA